MKKALFWVITLFTLFIALAALELNKNRLWGFGLCLLLAAVYIIVHFRLLKKARRIVRFAVWLLFAAALAGAFIVSWPPTRAVPAVEAHKPERTGVVTVAQGELVGVYNDDKTVEIFAGIPYAEPPVGGLRWREPVPAGPWEGVYEADSFAPMSMQPVSVPLVDSLKQIIGYHDYRISLKDNYVAPVSEDSLYLNIWKPAGETEGLPVLVYVHGGSLQTGQPWYADYSGEGLAKQGVIVVNMGYRLGVFGFMASEQAAGESPNGTTGNYGLLDQIMALEWVRDNIAAFGGDPNNVTLAGESAGAACVSALCVSPLAKGLFNRAVMESSTVASKEPPHSFRSYEDALESGRELMRRYGCSTLDELRALPAEKLVDEAYTQHEMTVDGYVLPCRPCEAYERGELNCSAIMHGYNSRESGPFIMFDNADLKNYESKVRAVFEENADEVLSLYPAETDEQAKENWAMIWGAVFFDHPHYCLDRLAGQSGVPCYEYLFSKDNGRLGAWHSGEEIYLYGNIPADSKLFDERDRQLSSEMLSYFVNFIRTGDPNGGGLPAWEDAADGSKLMEFGVETRMIPESKLRLFEIMDRAFDGRSD